MTPARLLLRTATYFWRTNLAVILGVAAAVAVLSGALLVGDSVRGSLRTIALGRLGATDHVVSSGGFFSETLAERLDASSDGVRTAPLIVASGFVRHGESGRTAGNVLVYGVDDRFWQFNGVTAPEGVVVSPALAAELTLEPGDVLLTRLQKPSQIPLESLFARKDDMGRTLRLTASGVLPRARLGEFSLRPQQAEVRAVFVPLASIQRDLAVPGRVNTILLAGTADKDVSAQVRQRVTLEDLDVGVSLEGDAIAIHTGSGILPDALADAAGRAAAKLDVQAVPVFTYLANTLRSGTREVPYSLITATDLSQVVGAPVTDSADSIVLNEWVARELGVKTGDRVELDYYLWNAGSGLTTHTAAFTVLQVVPIQGLAAERRLAPEYPGITAADSLADWDPPFPIDLSRVRPQDEQYWERYRTTPKAFIPYERGRQLWQTRYGRMTSVRFPLAQGVGGPPLLRAMQGELRATLAPESVGFTVVPVRQAALQASAGATDFGEYFTYFSFFLVVSALLLAVLFFRLGVEQRLRQIGTLRAAGFGVSRIRGLLLAEAALLALAGSVIGAACAILYAHGIVYGLRTWWVGAVGTTSLDVHVRWQSLAFGVIAGLLAALASVFVSLRTVARLSPRALLTARSMESDVAGDGRRARRSRAIAALLALAGLAMLGAGFRDSAPRTALFFGAGASLLTAAMFFFSAWLRARDVRPVKGHGAWAISALGFRSAAHRPSRSVMCAALIAAAAFIIVSVDAFRRGAPETGGDIRSGTGGYELIARSELPLLNDPDTPAGREALAVDEQAVGAIRWAPFRVHQGEDASCLNLYRPTAPTIVAPTPAFIASNRFSFANSLAETEAERANPWRLLQRKTEDGTVPAIADATSLQYVLHLGVGDTMTIDAGGAEPVRLRFVGAVADSVLQGEIIVGEDQFLRLFPGEQGYRLFLIDGGEAETAQDVQALARTVEEEFAPFGLDAVTTAERLAAFHRVENTYLSTFQALGGLGLLLGTIGLSAVMFRNVLERRRELALLRAVGFDRRRVGIVIMAEAILLLAAGLLAGTACAVLAVAPAWFGRGGTAPGTGLALLLAGVALAGVVSSWLATRAALAGNMLKALRTE